MHTFLQSIPFQRLALEQVPIIGVSFIIAELFYKFHSFTLECLAFLATWYVLDAAFQFVRKLIQQN